MKNIALVSLMCVLATACTKRNGPVTHEEYVRSCVAPLYEEEIIKPLKALPRQAWTDEALALVREELDARMRAVHHFAPSHYEKARELVGRGCDWPVIKVLGILADFAKVSTQNDSLVTRRAFDIVLGAKREGKQPPMLLLVMAAIVKEHGAQSFYYREVANALEKFIVSRKWGDDELRPLFDIISEFGLGGDETYLRTLVKVESPVLKSGWLREMLDGLIAYRTAWSARGGGWASTVTDKGWEGYEANIATAKQHFEAAYAMRPDLPTSAKMMINCNRGEEEDCRLWFDRTVAIEPDLWTAYREYVFTIRPRWGGSEEQLMAFADECFERGRKHPSMALEGPLVIYVLANEKGKRWSEVFTEHVYTNMLEMVRLYRSQDFHPDVMMRNACHMMLTPAYLRGDFDTLVRCAKIDFADWPDKATDNIFNVDAAVASNMKNIALAFSGEGASDLLVAEKAKRDGDFVRARQLFRDFLRIRQSATNEFANALALEYAAGEVVRLNKGLFGSEQTDYSIMPEVLKTLSRWSFWRCWDKSWTVDPDGSWVIRRGIGPLQATWPIIPSQCKVTADVEKVDRKKEAGFGFMPDGWESPGVIIDLFDTGSKASWCSFAKPYAYRTVRRTGERVDALALGRHSFRLELSFLADRTEVAIDGVPFPELKRQGDEVFGDRFPVIFGSNVRIKSMKVGPVDKAKSTPDDSADGSLLQ